MFVLLLIFVVALIGFGFLNPMWWVAAGVLIFGLAHFGRGGSGRRSHGGDPDYRDYRDYRDQQDRWARRYSRQRRSRWNRQDSRDRRDHDHRR
ncbi:hypothetical protein ABZ208_23350 [Streptomyces sp. NPDC006208]|uniref:hypothetical protein n=1 Tax=Streptomyces sp. NPDC006208 TaxID=3156734 RepID=UPI0033B448F7